MGPRSPRRSTHTRARSRAAIASVLVAVALVAPACGDDDADSVAITDASGAPLAFSAPLVGGGTFDGAEVSERPVAFWFWAPT